jgi:hypothetical protein
MLNLRSIAMFTMYRIQCPEIHTQSLKSQADMAFRYVQRAEVPLENMSKKTPITYGDRGQQARLHVPAGSGMSLYRDASELAVMSS